MQKLFAHFLIFIVFTLGICTSVLAGGADAGGGGAGIFCGPEVKNQPRVQLLDMFEGKVINQYIYLEKPAPFKQQIAEIVSSFDFDLGFVQDLNNELQTFEKTMETWPHGVGISIPPDVGNQIVPVPTGCQLAGIGFYRDNRLVVSIDALELMTETQKAAFFLHEAIYKLHRERMPVGFGLPTGPEATRKLVAHLFSLQKNLETLNQLSRFMSRQRSHLDSRDQTWHPASHRIANRFSRVLHFRDDVDSYRSQANIFIDRSKFKLVISSFYSKAFEDAFLLSCETKSGQIRSLGGAHFYFDSPTDHRYIVEAVPIQCAQLFIRFSNDDRVYPPRFYEVAPAEFQVSIDDQEYIIGRYPIGVLKGNRMSIEIILNLQYLKP